MQLGQEAVYDLLPNAEILSTLNKHHDRLEELRLQILELKEEIKLIRGSK